MKKLNLSNQIYSNMFLNTFIVFILVVFLFCCSSCESESGKRDRIKTYRVTYVLFSQGKSLKCVANIEARNIITASTVIKENTFISCDSVSINTIRLIK